MGFRFQKRFRLFPGVRINLSKSGVSTSIGVRGARMTFGRGKTRTTIGIPGTGISHTSIESEQPRISGYVDNRWAWGIIAAMIIIPYLIAKLTT